MNLYASLLEAHRGIRSLVVFFLAVVWFRAAWGLWRHKPYTRFLNGWAVALVGSVHLQFLLGIILYLLSPLVSSFWLDFGSGMKDPVLRFWGIEHPFSMLFFFAFVQAGRGLSRRAPTDHLKHRRLVVWLSLALVVLCIGMPWPFRDLVGRAWF